MRGEVFSNEEQEVSKESGPAGDIMMRYPSNAMTSQLSKSELQANRYSQVTMMVGGSKSGLPPRQINKRAASNMVRASMKRDATIKKIEPPQITSTNKSDLAELSKPIVDNHLETFRQLPVNSITSISPSN
jgi:hypothetical protein